MRGLVWQELNKHAPTSVTHRKLSVFAVAFIFMYACAYDETCFLNMELSSFYLP